MYQIPTFVYGNSSIEFLLTYYLYNGSWSFWNLHRTIHIQKALFIRDSFLRLLVKRVKMIGYY